MVQTATRMGFHLITDPSMGGGVERWLINTLHNVPDNVEISIISTNFSDQKRLEKEADYLLKFHSVKLDLIENNLRFFRKSRILSFILDTIFIPFLVLLFSPFYKIKLNKESLDVVYLTKNQYWRLFKGEKMIGSSHTEFHDQGLVSMMKARLYAAGLIYRGIGAFHVYPGRDSLSGILGRKATILKLPNGSPEIVCNAPSNHGNVKFLYVGRLETIKGIEVLIQGWKMSGISGSASLKIVGTGSYKPLDLAPYGIQFMGKLSDEDLKREYCNADIFIYPTLWDSFPYTVLEAMSAGCFVISGRVIRSSFIDAEKERIMKFIKSTPEEVSLSLKTAMESVDSLRIEKSRRIEFFRNNYNSESVNEKFFKFVDSFYLGHVEKK